MEFVIRQRMMGRTQLCILMVSILVYVSCQRKPAGGLTEIAKDSVSIMAGKTLFQLHCSGCHNFTQNGIGPSLGGITNQVSPGWLRGFIHNPDSILTSQDTRGKMLAATYKIPMPAFPKISSEETGQIIAFINFQKPAALEGGSAEALKDPIPAAIDSSDLIATLEFVVQLPSSDEATPRTRITKLDVQRGSNVLFILDLRGKLYRVERGLPMVYMDMAVTRKDFINKPGLATGFGSFAFHPDFATNGLLYTTHSESLKSSPGKKIDFDYADSIPSVLQWVVTEWKTPRPESAPFAGTSRELFRIKMVAGLHGVQEIAFNPLAKKGDEDYGLLHVAIGDGGAVENGYPFLAHNTAMPWGTILRIDPSGTNSKNGKYGIPKGNPFSETKDPLILKEIFAYGFRNPHRISWTRDGKMLAVNIGHGQIDALDIVLKGHDYGWPIREGTFLVNPAGDLDKVYNLPAADENYHVTYPVAQYDHSEGKAISGGYEYTGSLAPQFADKYIFGDIPTGNLFFVEVEELKIGSQAKIRKWQVAFNGKIQRLSELCGSPRVDLHFGKDSNGDLYILTKPDGKVYRLTK